MYDEKRTHVVAKLVSNTHAARAQSLSSAPIGLNVEYIIRNNLERQNVFVFTEGGALIGIVEPSNQKTPMGMPLEGIELYYRMVNGDRNDVKKSHQTQDIMKADVSYLDIKKGPVFVEGMRIYLALSEQQSEVLTFQQTVSRLLTNRYELGEGQEPYPYVIYANMPQLGSHMFMAIGGTEIVRMPVIQTKILGSGLISFGRSVVDNNGRWMPRVFISDFADLYEDKEDDVFVLDNTIVVSPRLDSVRRYIQKLRDKALLEIENKPINLAEEAFIADHVQKSVNAAVEDKERTIFRLNEKITQVNQERTTLQDSLNRSEADRVRLDKHIKSLEAQMEEEQKEFRRKEEDAKRREEEKIRKHRTRSESFKATAVLISTVVSTIALLKAPLTAAAKWIGARLPAFLKTTSMAAA